MTALDFYKTLRKEFKFPPTDKQDIALQQLARFCVQADDATIYMLKGYAGTGKTTLISTLVTQLWHVKRSVVLLAPTGRAAKVISQYSGKTAHTIHRKIYHPKSRKGGGVRFTMQPNKHRNAIFIVDEASMVPDTSVDAKFFEGRSLLDDLISYVYSGVNCQLILVGDTAQLPPVHLELSPALDPVVLESNYQKTVQSIELDQVMRQSENSGILFNASRIRHALSNADYLGLRFSIGHSPEVIRPESGQELMEAIEQSYAEQGYEDTVIIVRSNKRANLYNQQIRQRILFQEEELSASDYLMVVKNNYFWLKPHDEAGFIANGDIIEILEIYGFSELYGFRFAQVRVRMVDYPSMSPFDTVLLLDTLTAETPSLSYDDANKLYEAVKEDYHEERSNYKKFLAIKGNKYFNALQVKFSYAITCHKSQGGQWHTVFIEQPYLKDGMDRDYLRWLYTALTRAKSRVYLMGFAKDFFEE
mgnify:FL=1|jgi:ATP-dependent exoDNAse (exonuclease V) alpha subunit